MRNESIISSARNFKLSAKSLNSYLGFEMCIPEVSKKTPSSCWNILEYHGFNSGLRLCTHAFVFQSNSLARVYMGAEMKREKHAHGGRKKRKWKEERPTGGGEKTYSFRICQTPWDSRVLETPHKGNFTVWGLVAVVGAKVSGDVSNRNTPTNFWIRPGWNQTRGNQTYAQEI